MAKCCFKHFFVYKNFINVILSEILLSLIATPALWLSPSLRLRFIAYCRAWACLLFIFVPPRPVTSLGRQEEQRVFWEGSKFFKLCPTHFSRGGGKFGSGASPLLVTGLVPPPTSLIEAVARARFIGTSHCSCSIYSFHVCPFANVAGDKNKKYRSYYALSRLRSIALYSTHPFEHRTLDLNSNPMDSSHLGIIRSQTNMNEHSTQKTRATGVIIALWRTPRNNGQVLIRTSHSLLRYQHHRATMVLLPTSQSNQNESKRKFQRKPRTVAFSVSQYKSRDEPE